MKRSFKNISLISLFLFSLASFAKAPRAVVSMVKGNVFLLKNGSMNSLEVGEHIYEFDEIFTEIGSTVTLNDYYDNEFHLSGSTNLKVMNKLMILKSGYMWVQVTEPRTEKFMIQTINSNLSYHQGEFVISFDQENKKTQVLSLKGTHEFVNVQNRFYREEIPSGFFSFIADDYENGNPRMATDIGAKAYSSVLSLFDGIKPLNSQAPKAKEVIAKSPVRKVEFKSRSLASVKKASKNEGEVIVITKPKMSAQRVEKLKNLHLNKISHLKKTVKRPKRKFRVSYGTKSNVKVKVFRPGKQRVPASNTRVSATRSTKIRKPASIRELNPQVKIKKNPFETSLLKEYKKQMRHSKEINSLINELKSIDNDYNESY